MNIIKYAKSFIGQPYHWGGDDPVNGFDCSGLICELLRAAGKVSYSFRTNANGLYKKYHDSKIKKPSKGLLVFFGSSTRITHIGICLDNKYMLEAGGGGKNTTNDNTAARRNAFVRIRPLSMRRDNQGYGKIFVDVLED